MFNKIVFDNDKICLVYEKDNEIIGFCIAQINLTGENKTKTLFINYIFVSQSYRRNKIGTLLMSKLQEIAKQYKCNKIQLSVFCFNQNAIEFYKKIGMNEQKIVMEQFVKDLK